MGLIKTTLPPMASNVLGVELSQIEGTKVLEAASQTNFCGLIDMLSLVAVRANEIFSGIASFSSLSYTNMLMFILQEY